MNTAILKEFRPKSQVAKSTVLLVDDDRLLVESTRMWLEHLGFQIVTASNLQQARARLTDSPIDLLLTDLRLDEGCGLEILRTAQAIRPECPRLAMTGYLSTDFEIQAIRAGALKVLSKPLDDDQLLSVIQKVLGEHQLAQEDRRLSSELDRRAKADGPCQDQWFGMGNKMQEIFDLVDRIADSKASVLITGEPGTGKSKLAKTVHQRSVRRSGPFVELACGGIPETLLESELFGHCAGAFTGAMQNKLGKFQYAQGGTLFLDEITTASMAMQVRLLRVLQSRQFEAVGSNETITTDARMIFATNEDLRHAVAMGHFREDLFYRIHVVPIELPPLRERLEDLRELADGFLAQACLEFDRQIDGFSPGAYRAMLEYPWPGNIRELENTIQRAVLVSIGNRIDAQDIERLLIKDTLVRSSKSQIDSTCRKRNPNQSRFGWSEHFKDLDEALLEPEREILIGALEANGWNRQATAIRLGINRTTLYKKMKRLGIEISGSFQ
jgi:DNA-binding NtrC family response regulator